MAGFARHCALRWGSEPCVFCLRPQHRRLGDYGQALLRSKPYVALFARASDGVRIGQWDLSDQRHETNTRGRAARRGANWRIVRFLDHADKRIRRFIAAKRRLIELLNEQKQAIIQKAVTRGLDPNVRLKPSGLDWLGDIPEQWDVRRVRSLVASIDQGVSPQAEAILADDASWGVLKAGCVNHGVFKEKEHKRLPKEFAFDPSLAVRVGDVLISRACGSPKLVGSVARVRSLQYQLILSDKTFRLNFREPRLAEFLVMAMNTRYFRVQVEKAISGAEGLANNIPLSALKDFRLAVPPVSEAEAIAKRLANRTTKIDAFRETAASEADLMGEYRTRLIADVVTGKLDVRGIELRPLEEVDEPPSVGDEIADDAPEEGDEPEPVDEITDGVS